MARLIQPMVRASSGGRTSSASIGGMRQMRIASISALRPMRSTSDSACFRFNRPLSPSLERWSIVRAYRPSSRVGTLPAAWALGGQARANEPFPHPPHHESHSLGGVHVPQARSCCRGHTACSCAGRLCADEGDGDAVQVKTGDAAVAALQAAPMPSPTPAPARFEMVMEMAVMGEPFELVATGAYDADAQQMSMSMDMGAMFEQLAAATGEEIPVELGDGAMEMVADGDTVYMRSPLFEMFAGTTGWLSMSCGGPRCRRRRASGSGPPPSDPTKMLESLRGVAGEPEVVGQEDVRGVDDHPLPRHHEPGRRARRGAGEPSAPRSRPRSSSSARSATPRCPSTSGSTVTTCRAA